MNQRIHQIVIVGGGTAGWMVAAAFSRFLGRDYTITLVESDAIGTVGVGEATIPQIRLFNEALGIEEPEFLAATEGSYKLGIEFADWRRPGHRYMHAFGQVGRSMGLVPFHHYWLAEHATGRAQPFGDYALNEVIARHGSFAHVMPKPGSPVPDVPYAFHFDAGLYAGFLRRYAEARGVTRIEGRIAHVEQDGERGNITTLVLDGERRVEGQFFIDCSGFRGLLIAETLGVGYDDWTQWLPCDRALAVPCARVGKDITPYTRSTAQAAGWQWRIPLQHRTGNGYVYCSGAISDDEAAATLLAGLDGAAMAEPKPLTFRPGMRRAMWHRNVVAVGLASGFMEPLESTSIHLIQTAIERILAALPNDCIEAAEVEAYNRQARFEYERIRDFLVLHYHANDRPEPFWAQCRAMALPDTLTEKLALFRAGARVFRTGDELFTEAGWTQVLIGQGVTPRSWHPLVGVLGAAERTGFMDTISQMCTEVAAAIPDHGDYVGQMAARALPTRAVA